MVRTLIRITLAAGVLGLLLGLLTRIPLAWVLGGSLSGFDANARAVGTVWNGAVVGIDGLPPIQTRLRGTEVELTADGPTLTLRARAGRSSLSDVALTSPIAALARFDPRLAGLDGEAAITLERVEFAQGRCTAAIGTAATDVLASNAARWSWQGPKLSGPVTCEEGEVVLSLEGEDATQAATARLQIDPAGPYRTEVGLSTDEPGAGLVLPLFGFEPAGANRWRLSESGSWQ